jgi:hypothetical protein
MQNTHSACPACRYTTKYQPGPCPHCGKALVYMGKNFRPPRAGNKSQWKKIELAVSAPKHHPNCWYAGNRSDGKWDDGRWVFCQCPSFRDFHTPADVRSGRGLRRSRRKNYAPRQRKRGEGLIPYRLRYTPI